MKSTTEADLAEGLRNRELVLLGKEVVHGVRSGAALEEITPILSELKLVSNELVRLPADLEEDGLHALYGTDRLC